MKRDDDPFQSAAYKRYAKHFFEDVAPQVRDSAYMVTIAPPTSAADVQMATELGYAILTDKPLIVLVPTGRRAHMAQKLLRIADHVVEGDIDTEQGRAELHTKLAAIMNQ